MGFWSPIPGVNQSRTMAQCKHPIKMNYYYYYLFWTLSFHKTFEEVGVAKIFEPMVFLRIV